MNLEAKNILKNTFGFDQFRPQQEEIINAVIEGYDVMALLPTGGGKSLCYQISGLVRTGICIVISPLVALIKDQVNALKQKGIKATGITGGISYKDLDDILDNCIYGQYQFLYLSPERLQQSLVQERISKMRVSLIAVDEAHCVSQWGHDFRPAYRDINLLRTIHKEIPIIAVTATATESVQLDIIDNLELKSAQVFKNSYLRPNISYQITNTTDKNDSYINFYKKYVGSSVTYVRSRKNAITYSRLLTTNGISSGFFHGGLPNKVKVDTAQRWMKNETQVIVATNAFGMGIDKPDVRTVTHLQLPDSIESYYQETGRAGRDGKESIAQFFYNINDINHAQNQFIKSLPTVENIKFVYRKLNNYLRIAMHEGENTTHQLSFSDFATTYSINGMMCYNALLTLDRFSVISLSQSYHRRSNIRFRESGKNIIDFLGNQKDMNAIVQAILRTYGSSTYQDLEINTSIIALRSNTSEQKVIETLQKLEELELIEANIIDADTQINFLEPRDDDRTINRFSKELTKQNKIKKQKLEQMFYLVTQKQKCINVLILRYFGEKSQPCGKCSVCIGKVPQILVLDKIKDLLINKDLNSGDIASLLPQIDKNNLIETISLLLEQGKVSLLDNHKYHWNG
ncbi:RecQ family ATP-dependent DNA helicase [Nonlabens ulvanivorans]|uniref:ATP-dependent DNA helicase RecQ n=1 Tax=Nonlabens ulvanivorans TaxID=906888 RepID=A0A084JWD8_NONUL|nr:ATP-dependent DNA helicase RecQ [Nonlabens ulvanivorans]KEZ93272.1 DEAD/DEAH box helicase [Nonlabens ulvanivorans]PRX13605.1 ATP-dependent DNA helicase RecQ [Nonlabens ulvanivorans]